ncbi:hypothetical protein BS47DRAFT_268980 [Hydnum rufescens UP504]|uniref:Uncharacterized protein n=1 Tax=Hydnum rufescens UP504 TaxID=1448309 RepID=A0A9P6DMG1_9AGAM|nr:hypothetical protein BS47DRAFT_268980 [Hydnum rufescens UP504]
MSRMIQHTAGWVIRVKDGCNVRISPQTPSWCLAATERTRLTHVGLNQVDPDTFFGVPVGPPHAELITYLDLAVIPEKGETPVDDFVAHRPTSVSSIAQNDILLLVQEDNRLELGEPVNA